MVASKLAVGEDQGWFGGGMRLDFSSSACWIVSLISALNLLPEALQTYPSRGAGVDLQRSNGDQAAYGEISKKIFTWGELWMLPVDNKFQKGLSTISDIVQELRPSRANNGVELHSFPTMEVPRATKSITTVPSFLL